MKITKYTDPSHGWYKVKMSLVCDAMTRGVTFSAFSYRSVCGKYAFLEEDRDAPLFFSVMGEFQIEYKHSSKRSRIRNYSTLS